MEINTERVNRVVIPRSALAKRVGILWLFEIIACLCGLKIFGIVSVFCVIVLVWLTVKIRPIWSLYYHNATLYILLILLIIPAVPIGLGMRRLIYWMIFNLPSLIF